MLDKSQTSCLTLIPAIEFSARLALIEKNYDLAAKLFHKAQQLRVISSMPVPRSEEEDYRDLEEELEKQLGENKFQQRKLEGQNLSLEEAIHLSKELLS